MDAIFCNFESKNNIFLTPYPPKNRRNFLNVSTEKIRSKSDSNTPFTKKSCDIMSSKIGACNDENFAISQRKTFNQGSLSRSPFQPLNLNSEIRNSESKNIGRYGKESTFSTPQLPRVTKTNASIFRSADKRLNLSPQISTQKTGLIRHDISRDYKKFVIFDEFTMKMKEDSPKPSLHSQAQTSNVKDNASNVHVRIEVPAAVNMFEKVENIKGYNDLTSTSSVNKTVDNSELFYEFENLSETETTGSTFWSEDYNHLVVASIEDIAASASTWSLIEKKECLYCSLNTSFDLEPTETADPVSPLSVEIKPESIDFPWDDCNYTP